MKNINGASFSNIRELEIEQATLASGAQASGGCADACYEWPGCDCFPGPGERAGYNLGLMLSHYYVNPSASDSAASVQARRPEVNQ